MKIILKKEKEESQPAIDTLCDNCGAIYDLLDCTTCACGRILCPECTCENITENEKKPDRKHRHSYNMLDVFDQRSSFK